MIDGRNNIESREGLVSGTVIDFDEIVPSGKSPLLGNFDCFTKLL